MVTLTDAQRFLAAHPYYTAEHVEHIARVKAEQSIPFCEVCLDWHIPVEEEHSMVEEPQS
jgi:hypothetical protein